MNAIPDMEGRLLLLGAGRMGTAMLRGWLASGLPAERIVVLDPAPSEEVRRLTGDAGAILNPPAGELGNVSVLVAAVKPQVMDEALSGIVPALSAGGTPLILSIAAGRTIASFKRHFGEDAPVIRAMPNTPAAIGEGITGFAASAEVSAAQKDMARALLSALGEVVEVADESLIDAVTAVSGSGPAYVFLLAECLAEAGVRQGLPPELAARLAQATVSGAGALLKASGEAPAALRRAVTSPGGTTAAALEVLMDDREGLCRLMERAVAAAARHSRELAGGKD